MSMSLEKLSVECALAQKALQRARFAMIEYQTVRLLRHLGLNNVIDWSPHITITTKSSTDSAGDLVSYDHYEIKVTYTARNGQLVSFCFTMGTETGWNAFGNKYRKAKISQSFFEKVCVLEGKEDSDDSSSDDDGDDDIPDATDLCIRFKAGQDVDIINVSTDDPLFLLYHLAAKRLRFNDKELENYIVSDDYILGREFCYPQFPKGE